MPFYSNSLCIKFAYMYVKLIFKRCRPSHEKKQCPLEMETILQGNTNVH